MNRAPALLTIVVAAAILSADVPARTEAATSAAAPAATAEGSPFRAIDPPAAAGSGQPNLAISPDGRVWLSWIEQATGGVRSLRASRLEGERWGPAIELVASDSLLGISVDPPALLPQGGVRLAALYPWKLPGAHARELRMMQSLTGGGTWTRPLVVHDDATATEHGFASMTTDTLGARAIWLDGRKSAVTDSTGKLTVLEEGIADMQLRTAVLTIDGTLADERELDARVCDCCPTAVAATPTGAVVAYRDRSAGEIRDISVMRLDRGVWSAPHTVHADGWKMEGCPVNGPAIGAAGERVAVAWYTAPRDSGRVMVALSRNGGRGFERPVRVDLGAPMGRPAIAVQDDGSALVAWLETAGPKQMRVVMRRIGADGAAGPLATVATMPSGRGGIPRMVRVGDHAVLAWTQSGDPQRVRTAIAPFDASASR